MAKNLTHRQLAVAVFVLSVLVRLLYVATIKDCYFFEHLQTEPRNYQDWAELIMAGNGPLPPYEQGPGYPYFLALIGPSAGSWAARVAYAQAILGALTPALLAAASHRLFGWRAAIATGLIGAFYGPLIYYGGAMLPEALFVVLCSAALFSAVVAGDSSAATQPRDSRRATARGWWWGSGVLWCLAFLVRPNVLLAVPFAGYDAYQRGRKAALLRILAPTGIVWSGLVFINYLYGGRFVATVGSGGENFWLGNNPLADGVNPFPTGRLSVVAERIGAVATDMIDANDRLSAIAWTFLREQPLDALALAGKKLLWTFHDRELPNAGDPGWELSHSWLFGIPGFPFSFGVLLVVALSGIVLAWPNLTRSSLLLGCLAAGIGTCVVFFTNGRFRLILVPPLLIWAGAGFDAAITAFQRRAASPQKVLVALLAAGLGALLAFNDFAHVQGYFVPDIAVNIGILEEGAGDLEAALAALQRGVGKNPEDTLGRVHLASVLERLGKNDEAMRVYSDGLAISPHDAALASAIEQYLERHPATR